jgi:tRNA A37 threonylcarbamoyladenosine synthetase subunit TsaC/SUA5/YrdC
VGVRLPGDPLSQALLSRLDRPLLCTSVHVDEALAEEGYDADRDRYVFDMARLVDVYGHRGVDFVCAAGPVELEG